MTNTCSMSAQDALDKCLTAVGELPARVPRHATAAFDAVIAQLVVNDSHQEATAPFAPAAPRCLDGGDFFLVRDAERGPAATGRDHVRVLDLEARAL
jgi:hypothetical protein